MKHETDTDQIREQAALYALGAMTEDEAAAFGAHLDEGCAVCRSEVTAFSRVTAALAETVPLVDPPPSLGRRLREAVQREGTRAAGAPRQVWKEWEPESATGPIFVKRQSEGAWKPTGTRGVTARQLFVDREADRVTMLVRMLPGTSYPPHRHGGVEECFVLSGDLSVGGTIIRAGDYQRMETGQVHPVQSTEEGCLLLLVSSLHDEILA